MNEGSDRASDEPRVNVEKASEETRVVPPREQRAEVTRTRSYPPPSEFVPGERFAGFVIEREIGRGRMGIVYRAKRLSLDRVEAVKIMAPAFSHDPEIRTRFKLEAMHAAIASHPHVVTVYDAEERGDLLYIAMEYIGGTDLKARIASDGAVPPATASEITRQLASALDAAHAVGVIHRDVKPANILLAGERWREHAHLTDFGVSRRLDDPIDLTAHGSTVGTPHYTAPEAYQNGLVDHRADVYSLGCVLFEMLTGRKPFPGSSSTQVAIAHVNQPPPEVHRVADPTLHPFNQVIRKSMAKDPAERYQSAGEMGAAAVAAAERNAGGEAAPTAVLPPTDRGSVPPPPLVGDRSRRRGRLALLICAIVGLALVGGGVGAVIATSSGGSANSHTPHPAPISPSQAALTHTAIAKTTNPILKAVENVNVSVTAKGMLPPSSCKLMQASMVTCTNPIPAVDAVSFQTFPSMKALYAAYVKRVSELAQGPFRANFSNCTEVDTNGEVSWNHNYKHPSIYPLSDFTSGRITDDQAAGRVYCTFDQDMLHLVWTQDDGYLMGEISGAPHTDAYVWWRHVHHSVVLPGTPGMQNMKGMQSTNGMSGTTN
ncbi:MAG: serine/threonine protein kinase [Solirubrobacterales bacterium]|nr:serine/threonine protein kinase [Solirubrobacterales bacterium]